MRAWVASILTAVLAGCGAFGSHSDGSSGGEPPADAGAPPTDTGAPTDAAPASDSGGEPPDAGGTRSVLCGMTSCTGAGVNCCLAGDVGTCSVDRCLASAVTIQCDDTADCPGGFVCCVNHQNQTLQGSSCQAACADDFRACSPNVAGECGAGKGCVTYKTRFGGNNFVPDYPFFLCEP